MIETKHFSLIKPTIHTPFNVDFAWWKQHDNNWRVYIQSVLCLEHQKAYSEVQTGQDIDWVDDQTGEVTSVDGLSHVLITHCARQPGFLSEHTALVDAAFRILMANGNTPMTPAELGERLNRPPETILRTLAGSTVYKGIRPRKS
ncbi:MAG: hypothetical protein PHQ40_18730 [Anaerolineaceae bacterium]|nr:hypothetical protein [Anaerolineaceae bacterium]